MQKIQRNFRKQHLALRNAMSSQEILLKSKEIAANLYASEWYKDADEIFAYYPLGSEVNVAGFVKQALADGKKAALPRTREQFEMDFYYITSFQQLKKGKFNVLEPETDCERALPNKQIVLVPGIVFGKDKSRYGYGKGYYDRFFAKYPNLKRYAVCFAHQLEESLVMTEHDCFMHRIYTEKGLVK